MKLQTSYFVRQAQEADIAQLINLQFEVYPPARFPPINRWRASSLLAHQQVFPAGQLLIEVEGRVVASATTMQVRRAHAEKQHTFRDITGGVDLSAHTPNGDALYGVDICVSPFFRRRGLARALYNARFALQAEKGIPFLVGARIPGYGAVAAEVPVDAYVADVVAGRRDDPTLSAQLHLGFEPVLILPRYLADPETADHAVLLRRDPT